MKSRKYLLILIPIVAVIILFAILVVNYILTVINKAVESQIDDINGDDKSLAVISDELIEQTEAEYDIFKKHILNVNTESSGVKGQYKEYDNDFSEISTKMLSGVWIVNAYNGDGKELIYEIKSEVISGNLKIIFTDESNKILKEIPIDSDFEFNFSTQEGTIYYIKLVGESAEIKCKIYRNGYKP